MMLRKYKPCGINPDFLCVYQDENNTNHSVIGHTKYLLERRDWWGRQYRGQIGLRFPAKKPDTEIKYS